MAQKTEMKTPGVVQFNMHLPTKIIKKRDVYISSCPILDVVSQGETEEEAKNNLVEAVTAFAISCFERGTLEKVLEQCGINGMNLGASPEPQIPQQAAGNEPVAIQTPVWKSIRIPGEQ